MSQAAPNFWYTRTEPSVDTMRPEQLATKRNRNRNGFTGKVGSGKESKYYYRGRVWTGPTNSIGHWPTGA